MESEKLTEQGRERIEDTIWSAFDRWSIRNNQKLLEEQAKGSQEEKEDARERARHDGLFLTKRAFAPGFDRYVTRQMRSNSVIKRQSSILLKSCLISLLQDTGATTDEVIGKGRDQGQNPGREPNSSPAVTRRHFQRYVHDRFEEVIFPVTDDTAPKKAADARFSPFSTVFAPTELPKTEFTKEAEFYLDLDRANSFSNPDLILRTTLNSLLRYVTPENLQDLLDFRRESSRLLGEIGAFGEAGDFLANELNKFSPWIGIFHAHFQSMLAVYWYRSRRPQRKEELMERGFPLRYSLEDARKAVPLLVNLTQDQELACKIIEDGANALLTYSLPDSHDHLVRQCLALLELPKRTLAAISENSAFMHRNSGNYKRMLRFATAALGFAREAGDAYLLCICQRDVAEAEWYLGRRKLSLSTLRSVERAALSLPSDKEKFGAYYNLATGCRRLGLDREEFGYLKHTLKFADSADPETVLAVDRRIGELISRL